VGKRGCCGKVNYIYLNGRKFLARDSNPLIQNSFSNTPPTWLLWVYVATS
jgi:hypothetical protein